MYGLLEDPHELVHDVRDHKVLGAGRLAGRYKFRETVLYDFIDSGAEDFVTYVEGNKGE